MINPQMFVIAHKHLTAYCTYPKDSRDCITKYPLPIAKCTRKQIYKFQHRDPLEKNERISNPSLAIATYDCEVAFMMQVNCWKATAEN